jgi:GntR family transcriptional repressor for pyruvate dehydrogenase complex
MSKDVLFETVSDKTKLVDRVVRTIESAVINGRLLTDTKLPPERELAVQLGVSRTVVREAVQILSAKGLLESRRGVGTIVQQITIGKVTEPLTLLLQSKGETISFAYLHQVRSILEVAIAGLAAQGAGEAEINRLQQLMSDMEAALDNPMLFAAKDADFHYTLAQATHNPILIVFLDTIRDLLQDYLISVIPKLALRDKVLPYHQHILEKVSAKDSEGACEAMRQHLAQIARNHEEIFG